jgi:acyl CoA:acetate/3-ketoacid CoA transferase alpha subunit/acyl CoA:acetate/3-ketoacid CoA transferase beta subunit
LSSWRDIVDRKIAGVHESHRDKRMDLSEAVRRFVRPGMKINPCSLQSRPVAALQELCRQFAGEDPGFEFISSSLSGNYLQLVHLGLLGRAIVSFAGEGYPTPGPSPVTARALEDGRLELENWTMLTISQRLLAGAMGVPFFTTRSIAGSSLAADLEAAGHFAEIPDPFHPGRTQGVISAYHPDLSFVHAWAADPAGNAVCFPPYQENIYGALAARDGVIVTAHKLVTSEFIRRHAHLVRIPAEVVLSVSEAPFGSHPYGNYCEGSPELLPYANDYDFMREHRQAQDEEERYAAWVKEWILDVDGQDAYLAKLGEERIERLHFLATADSWRSELERHAARLDEARPAGPVEEMIVQGARAISARIAARGYRTVLSGVGQAALMAWLAAHRLRAEGVEIALVAETGMYGHDPRPGDPFLLNYWNLPTTTLLTDVFEALGLHGCGANNQCLATLGAGQLDRFGNVNSTLSEGGRFIVGSGGANDIVGAARETVVVAAQRRQTFVERVDYVTSPGERIDCVVSTMGRFEKRGGPPLVLTGYFRSAGSDRDEVLGAIRERCGWELEVADDLEELTPATEEELALLRVFDPERSFLGRSGKA